MPRRGLDVGFLCINCDFDGSCVNRIDSYLFLQSRKRYDNHFFSKKVRYKNTATAIVVVQRPFLSPSADWQTFWVLMIFPLAL